MKSRNILLEETSQDHQILHALCPDTCARHVFELLTKALPVMVVWRSLNSAVLSNDLSFAFMNFGKQAVDIASSTYVIDDMWCIVLSVLSKGLGLSFSLCVIFRLQYVRSKRDSFVHTMSIPVISTARSEQIHKDVGYLNN